MIDIHSHILPNLDDGSPDLDHTAKVIADAVRHGVEAIFATPHCCDGVYNCRKPDILSVWENVFKVLGGKNPDIQVYPGAEIRVNHDLVKRFDDGDLLTMGDAGKFLLLELPPMFIVNAVFQMIRQLRDRGIVPIIAHAERNPMILGRLDLAGELTSQGAVLQLTAGSLTGDFGKPELKTARALVENDQVFCLGSDMHPGRKYQMKNARKKLLKWVGPQRTQALLTDNPRLILKGVCSAGPAESPENSRLAGGHP
jgi:protein-tyrosine phosphatase